MDNLTQYWTLPATDQQTVTKGVQTQAAIQQSGQEPVRSTLSNALEVGWERVICASSLFIMIVQDCADLGGGYGLQIVALDKLVNKHFNTFDEIEPYLTKNTPYTKGSPVWMPLPNYTTYHSGTRETDFILKLWKENE